MNDSKEMSIQIYEEVLSYQQYAFPLYFFAGNEGKRCAITITRYVLEEKLGWDRQKICLNLCRETFETYRLAGMLKSYFQNSIFDLINTFYPGEFQLWELVRARRKLFTGTNGKLMARRAVRWLVIDQLQCTTKDLHKINKNIFEQYHLDNLLANVYKGSVWNAIQDADLWDGQPWEIRQTPKGYWQGETGMVHAIEAVHWLVEEKCRVPLDKLPENIQHNHFKKYGLAPMLDIVFSGSPYKAIDTAYPGRFKKWQFYSVGNGYWTGTEGLKHAKEALEWLIHEELKLDVEEIPSVMGKKTFKQYGLAGMLSELFCNSTSKALDLLYPGQFTTQVLRDAKILGRTN